MKGQRGNSRSSPVSPVWIMKGTNLAPCTAIIPKKITPERDDRTSATRCLSSENRE